jgi:type I restriction enzyme S subunit
MTGKWKEITLGECAAWLSGGTPFKGNGAFWSGTIPWVTAKDMKSFRLDDAEDHISPLAVGSGGKLVPAGTILLLVRGMKLHNDVPICMVTREMAFNQDIKALRPAKNVDGAFLAYWLLANKPDLLASVDHAGHGTGRLVTETLKEKTVLLPPLAEQKAIAAVLGALDDKIELNRRMNATLEAMARALFQSWFVDFDPVRAKLDGRPPAALDPATAALFPDSFQDSPIGPIPRGWSVKDLGEMAGFDKGLSYKGEGLADEGGMPMVNLGCFTGRGLFNAGRVKRYTGEYRERHLVNAGDLVVANTDMTQNRVIIGSPALVPELNGAKQFLFTHHVFAVRFKPGSEIWRRYVFFTLLKPEFREIAEGFSIGTTVLALPRDGLMNYSLCLPPVPLLEAFEKQVGPLLAAVDANRHQSRALATLRDTLLPKLLSGELAIAT